MDSSGSPIVNTNGEVLGIAQSILPAEVVKSGSEQPEDDVGGEVAKIGITYGLFNHYFPEMLSSAREFFDKGTAPRVNTEYTGLPNMEFRII